MKIMLCSAKTGLYFRSPDQWTADRELAENFANGAHAMLAAEQHGLEGVEVFWDFEDPEYNVRLPIKAVPIREQLQTVSN